MMNYYGNAINEVVCTSVINEVELIRKYNKWSVYN